jgi:hypothetical protein
MGRKQIHRGATLNVRVPVKTRFGAELLCQKYGVPLSTIVNRAVEVLMNQEGLTSRKDGDLLSLLDRLWDESEFRRMQNINRFAPELLSAMDRDILDRINHEICHVEEKIPDEKLDAHVASLRKSFSGS